MDKNETRAAYAERISQPPNRLVTPDVTPPVLRGLARDKAEQLAFDVDSLLDGNEDDTLGVILAPVRDFLRRLGGVTEPTITEIDATILGAVEKLDEELVKAGVVLKDVGDSGPGREILERVAEEYGMHPDTVLDYARAGEED